MSGFQQSRGERHASSSAGSGTPRVPTACWGHWAGLLWSNEARLAACMLMLYKIQSGLAHCPTLKDKLVPLPSHQRRTNDRQFTLLTTRTQCRGTSILPETIMDWNSLPMEVVEAPPLTLSCQGYQTEQLPTASPYPLVPDLFFLFCCPDQYNSEYPQL